MCQRLLKDRLSNMDSDAICLDPLAPVGSQATQVPIIGGQDDGRSPQEDLVRVQLRRRLPKDGSIHMSLEQLLVVRDESRADNFVQKHSEVVVAPKTVQVWVLGVLHIDGERPTLAEQRPGQP